jgi:epsilon-lactone hydrolase
VILPPRRPGRDPSAQLVERRRGSAVTAGQARAPGVEVASAELGGVSCVVCAPAGARGRLIHFHGGGYRLGSAAAWTPFGTRLASACGLEVRLPDYALAPERPFPAALHDAMAAVEASADGGPLFVSGDSAGGGLALSAALLAQQSGARIEGVALFSPWLDLTVTSAAYRICANTDQLFSRAAATEAAETYLQGVAADDPLASPLFADLSGAPPILVMVSAAEVLMQDSLALAQRCAEVGRAVQLHVVPNQPHVWPVLRPAAPESARALEATAAFFSHRSLETADA